MINNSLKCALYNDDGAPSIKNSFQHDIHFKLPEILRKFPSLPTGPFFWQIVVEKIFLSFFQGSCSKTKHAATKVSR